ncbi:AzlC family ABC transporter permease [Alkalibacter mobilis]|uniref:AzlC family ABC transporter permease n=1 Tax=Alkalibacter mobilis TaxID=2787712 RepID=UPI0018A02207|nr:AzlC family ABC transporter permease [Alkalibacter mobilis]MBF7097718.1 AzlC family ABC transporter permease [Alkalibacter mobilis]
MGVKSGIQSSLPICIGYIPLAIAYGVLGKSAGLSTYTIVLMSIMVYAGAAQFLSINLFAAGLPGPEIILTTFIINSRHLIMSTSLSRKLSSSVGTLARMMISFGITDESFSVSSIGNDGKKVTPGYLLGVVIPPYLFWVFGSLLGTFFSDFIPQSVENSMGIALYAMFIALLLPSMSKSKEISKVVIITAILHVVFLEFFANGSSGNGWILVLASVTGAFIGTFFFQEDFEDEN